MSSVEDDGEQTELQEDSLVRESSSVASAHVHVVSRNAHRTIVEIPPDGLLIGRETPTTPPAGLRLADTRLSRHHARIFHDERGWQLLDLGSRNQGFVDGRAFRRAERVYLTDRAVIRLADSVLVFREGVAPAQADGAELEPFPGCSIEAGIVRAQLARLARGSGHVLIVGETGTGKERVARALARPDGPFVPQNCAELTRELSRSELFGHVKGAFTGATETKPGLVELADGGVLFLDELGELPYEVQGELLRFLEDRGYRQVGGTTLRRSGARVIAATNVDLDRAIAEGKFRRDVLGRLHASNLELELPPLRDRREDLPGWIDRFVAEAGAPVDPGRWSAGALECLALYPWPGNLRELRGLVRNLLDQQLGRPISSDDLPDRIRGHRRGLRRPDDAEASLGGSSRGTPRSAPPVPAVRKPDPTEAEIRRALAETRGCMREAAKLRGIERTKLYRLCERFGISPDEYREQDDQI